MDHVDKATQMLARTIFRLCRRTSSRISELVGSGVTYDAPETLTHTFLAQMPFFLHAVNIRNSFPQRGDNRTALFPFAGDLW